MSELRSLAKLTYLRCEKLAEFSQSDWCMDRRYLTSEHRLANQQVADWMKELQMKTWQDEAGNQWGRHASKNTAAPSLIMGSHLDTVPNGGKYDGILGVVTPISLIAWLQQNQIDLPFHIDIVGFGDEEGTRFGTTLIGSRAVTGRWSQEWSNLQDENGIHLGKAMENFNLDITKTGHASRANDNIIGYIELHIEQGPVLEDKELSVGVVTAIAGAYRFQVELTGKAGHAGTVPMHMRQDSLLTCAKMQLEIERIAIEQGVVATVGFIQNQPNGVNVISGNTRFSIDIRSEDDDLLLKALSAIQQSLNEIAAKSDISIDWTQTHSAKAVTCDEKIQTLMQKALIKSKIEPCSLFSGAGHDAMEMANICPIGMLFMRCKGGISHHPGEAIMEEDIVVALDVLANTITLLANTSE